MAGVVPTAVRALQSCIRAGRWDEERRLPPHGQAVATELGAAAGVCVGDVGTRGETVRERRWSGPAEWRTDPADAARHPPGGRPPDLTCNTPPAWGQERLAAVVHARRRQGRGVVADEACGGHPSVRDGVAGLGLWDVADGPQTTRVWGERPAPHVPSGRGRGRRPPRDRVRDGAPEADPGLAVAAARPAAAGTRQTSNAGRQGPMVAACAARRVSAGRDPRPGPEVWVGRRRHPETGALQTDRCQAPLDLALTTRGPMRGRRGPIDTCGEDSTHRLGLGDDAVRGWAGGPHPLTVVRWAHGLVVRMRRRLNKTPPR